MSDTEREDMETFPVVDPNFEPEVIAEHQEIYKAVQEGRLTPQQLSRLLDRDDLLPDFLRIGGFERRLKIYLEKGVPGFLLALDIDDFKRFNDNRGHPAGDDLIRLAGKVLFEHTRTHPPTQEILERRQDRRQELDLLARGGDEFLVYLVGARVTSATYTALRIRRAIVTEVARLFPEYDSEQTMSLGLSYSKPEDDDRSLRQRADLALYDAKQGKSSGVPRNSVVIR